jgi:hemolysin type calcium-binding protein
LFVSKLVSRGGLVALPVVLVVALALAAVPAGAAPRCTITGTNGDDVLVGTPDRDVICGRGGDDVFKGGAGTDRVVDGPGSGDLFEYFTSVKWSSFPATETLTLKTTDTTPQACAGRVDNTVDRIPFATVRGWLDMRTDACAAAAYRGEVSITTKFSSQHTSGTIELRLWGRTWIVTCEGVTGVRCDVNDSNGSVVLEYPRAAGAAPRCTITGTNGDDVLVGTPGRDVICGRGGDDVLFGRGGDDVLRGGPGDDVFKGGAGDDRVVGGAGHDRVARGGAAGMDFQYRNAVFYSFPPDEPLTLGHTTVTPQACSGGGSNSVDAHEAMIKGWVDLHTEACAAAAARGELSITTRFSSPHTSGTIRHTLVGWFWSAACEDLTGVRYATYKTGDVALGYLG